MAVAARRSGTRSAAADLYHEAAAFFTRARTSLLKLVRPILLLLPFLRFRSLVLPPPSNRLPLPSLLLPPPVDELPPLRLRHLRQQLMRYRIHLTSRVGRGQLYSLGSFPALTEPSNHRTGSNHQKEEKWLNGVFCLRAMWPAMVW